MGGSPLVSTFYPHRLTPINESGGGRGLETNLLDWRFYPHRLPRDKLNQGGQLARRCGWSGDTGRQPYCSPFLYGGRNGNGEDEDEGEGCGAGEAGGE
jgi:hypothetical protein